MNMYVIKQLSYMINILNRNVCDIYDETLDEL